MTRSEQPAKAGIIVKTTQGLGRSPELLAALLDDVILLGPAGVLLEELEGWNLEIFKRTT